MSGFSFTKIVIIQSLDPTDFETGKELNGYLAGLSEDRPAFPDLELIDVPGRDEFLNTLERLIYEAENHRSTLILHLELHGWDDKTGLAFPDDSSLTWAELAAPLAKLNRATGFNLLLCVGACFGAYFLGTLRPLAPSPCFLLIGPTHRINPGDLLGSFRDFYRELLSSPGDTTAVKALFARRLNEGSFLIQPAELWFFKVVHGYLERDCTKGRLEERAANIQSQQAREKRKPIDTATAISLGVELSLRFLDKAFDHYFMTSDIPENSDRFSAALTDAQSRAREFFINQGLLTT